MADAQIEALRDEIRTKERTIRVLKKTLPRDAEMKASVQADIKTLEAQVRAAKAQLKSLGG